MKKLLKNNSTMKSNLDWHLIEQKWSHIWEEKKIFESNPHPRKKKFFLTVAYPYPNSPQHIGHGRTYTLTDAYARYLRMRGYNVLFPMAFHYTGTPVLAMAKRLQIKDIELSETFTEIYKVPKQILNSFTDPLKIAKYFHEEIKTGMKTMGYSIDWRREFTTIDSQYSKFIEWQFKVLHEKKLITKGSHPVGWCPSCGNPVGQHDTVGDVEPEIEEFILLKFKLNEKFLPTATLRPETVYGVTNIWINPDTEYVEAQVDEEKWIISREASEKLKHLNRLIKVKKGFKGLQLIGKTVINPANGSRIPILPAQFVDPDNATGVVMSVPAHAPYDFQALIDLKQNEEELNKFGLNFSTVKDIIPICIISVEGSYGIPAEEAIKKRKIKNQTDPKLEDATEEIYGREFHKGFMSKGTEPYTNLPVHEAKQQLILDFLQSRKADKMYEVINKPVKCRCGTLCIVKVFKDQWFINYGDLKWKQKTRDHLAEMKILPDEIRQEFEHTIGWLKEKACARQEGLGTKLPWDKKWVIESLSDSVIYMAYYTIAHILKQNNINSDHLTEQVFDYIFLEKGDIVEISKSSGLNIQTIKDMKREFQYYYPLDSRHSGRDLVPNHLTFFLFNHIAIFPKKLLPRQIVVNGSVLMDGKKMSKSFGNIIPLKEGVQKYGADALRLAILSTAGLLQDVDFSPTLAQSLKERLQRFYWTVKEIQLHPLQKTMPLNLEEKWLLSRLNQTIKTVTKAMDNLKIRDAIQAALYNFDLDIQWYLNKTSVDTNPERIKVAKALLCEIFKIRVKLLAPFTPFICEEIWQMLGEKELIANVEWPIYDEQAISIEVEETIDIIKKLTEDISQIIKVTKISPKKIVVYTCADWKTNIYREFLKTPQRVSNMGVLIKHVKKMHNVQGSEQEIAKYLKNIINEVSTLPQDLLQRKKKALTINEKKVIVHSKKFLEREFNSSFEVYSEDEEEIFDPKKRAPSSQPLRPALYIE